MNDILHANVDPDKQTDDCWSKRLVSVDEVATLLGCSRRHVYGLHDSARMPALVRLGTLIRWRREEIEDWIRQGCPSRSERARRAKA